MLTHDQVLDALRTVQEPELGDDLVSLDMIRDVEIDGDKVRFTLDLTTSFCPLVMEIQER
jgi:ATP-binding protein involved in chromosome partitioning